MKVLLKHGYLILIPQSEGECAELTQWKAPHEGQVFLVRAGEGEGLALANLGSRADVCQEPLNVISNSTSPQVQLLSNFAPTPFVLDERVYASVESFWQGLKFDREADRRRIAALSGKQARAEGEAQGYGETLCYQGERIRVGTHEHWQLMERACWAKFTQHEEARAALLATGERPLTHRVRRDSRTIPGVIMAEIWMKIRRRLQKQPVSMAR